jgi:TonB family protein
MSRETPLGPDFSMRDPAPDAAPPRPGDTRFQNELAVMAARFAAKNGGGLSPDVSAELALEIALNEIAQQACQSTGATGSAIVLQRDGEMVCRASSGLTAPDLGSRLDETSGLSGECIRTGQTQRCEDALVDPRVDLEASQRLGVRSVIVMPILRGAERVGVFELFSCQPNAFGESADEALKILGTRVVSCLERSAAVAAEVPSVERPTTQSIENLILELPENVPPRRLDLLTWVLGTAVLACAILLGVLIGGHLKMQKGGARSHPRPGANHASVSDSSTDDTRKARNELQRNQADKSLHTAADPNSVPEGGLVILEDGKEVFRLPAEEGENVHKGTEAHQTAPPAKGNAIAPASSRALPSAMLTLDDAESSLLHRVEPQYPDRARQAGVQGVVVLDLRIDSEGAVRNVRLVSGPPELAQASIDAVKQWRFKRHFADSRPSGIRTTVTLHFKLPS